MAFTNVSVTSSSPQIIYQPRSSWTRIADDSGFDAGGSHMVTADPNASATLTYNFSSFYLSAPRWPYQVACQITTGTTNSTVDLQDHTVPDLGGDSSAGPTVKSSVVFKGGTGEFGTQTIRISVPPGVGLAVVDMIVFETIIGNMNIASGGAAVSVSITGPASSNTASIVPSSSAPSTVQPSSESVVPWIVLTVGIVTLLAAVVIAFLIWKCKRKARRAETTQEIVDPLTSAVATDAHTLLTAQSSSLRFSRVDSSDKSSLGLAVDSFGHRHAYHIPSTSISESLGSQSLNSIPVPLTNVHDSSAPLKFNPSVLASLPSKSGHAESSRRFHVVNAHEEAPFTEISTPSPPRYSLAVAGSSLSVLPVFDKKYSC